MCVCVFGLNANHVVTNDYERTRTHDRPPPTEKHGAVVERVTHGGGHVPHDPAALKAVARFLYDTAVEA